MSHLQAVLDDLPLVLALLLDVRAGSQIQICSCFCPCSLILIMLAKQVYAVKYCH